MHIKITKEETIYHSSIRKGLNTPKVLATINEFTKENKARVSLYLKTIIFPFPKGRWCFDFFHILLHLRYEVMLVKKAF